MISNSFSIEKCTNFKSFSRVILIAILIIILNYKTQAKGDTRLQKTLRGHVPKWHQRYQGIILIRPKLTKYPNDIAKLLYSSSESDSSYHNQDALRGRAQSSDSEQYNSAELEKVIFLPNNTHKYIRTAEVVDSTNEDVKEGKPGQSLREKEEFKCIDACEEVLGNVCDAHSCKNKERHVFQKECFDACGSRFRK